MDQHFQSIKEIYSGGERFDEMQTYTDRSLKRWEEEVSALFPPGASILDIGCGKGREAFCLHDKGFRVTGIDISETVVEAAKQIAAANRLDIEFVVSNGKNLPFPDETFDAVVIWAQTFGLFYGDEAQRKILGECRRVLKGGGILSFSGHDKEYLAGTYPQYIKDGYLYPFASTLHYTCFTIDELSACASKAGLSVIDCKRGMIYKEEDGTIIHCECRK
jgi:ubiquinone/menaquinone biosynthesis C-methylase UbiE